MLRLPISAMGCSQTRRQWKISCLVPLGTEKSFFQSCMLEFRIWALLRNPTVKIQHGHCASSIHSYVCTSEAPSEEEDPLERLHQAAQLTLNSDVQLAKKSYTWGCISAQLFLQGHNILGCTLGGLPG